MRVKKGHPINRVLRRNASGLGWNGLVRDMRQPPPEATKKMRGKALWGRLYVQGVEIPLPTAPVDQTFQMWWPGRIVAAGALQ